MRKSVKTSIFNILTKNNNNIRSCATPTENGQPRRRCKERAVFKTTGGIIETTKYADDQLFSAKDMVGRLVETGRNFGMGSL